MAIQKGRSDFKESNFNKKLTIKSGTTIYDLGAGLFEIQTNTEERDIKDYSKYSGDYLTPVTMDDIIDDIPNDVVSDNGIEKNRVILNYNKKDLKNYSYFGSLKDNFSSAIINIINKFPASILITTRYDVPNFLTFINKTYDLVTDTTTFQVPINGIINNYGLILKDIETSDKGLRNLYYNYKNYVLWDYTTTYNIISYENDGTYLTLKVEGKAFGDNVSGDTEFHIKPQQKYLDIFMSGLNHLEKYLLSKQTLPKYTSIFNIFEENETGEKILIEKKFTWTTTDGYNLDYDTFEYQRYVEGLLDLGEKFDNDEANKIINNIIGEDLLYYDTDDEKFAKLLKSYGYILDDVKRYIDGIKHLKVLTYDKVDNIPDALIKDYVKSLGMGVVNTFNDDNFINSIISNSFNTDFQLPQLVYVYLLDNNGRYVLSNDGLYIVIQGEMENNQANTVIGGVSGGSSPAEIDNEIWRRIGINLSYLFKSKGTSLPIRFLLKLIGLPESIIDIREYIYQARNKVIVEDNYNLPIDDEGFPLPLNTEDMYYQMNGGWYVRRDVAPANSSSIENSVGVHEGEYDYGQTYINNFINAGFDLEKIQDNKKSFVIYDEDNTYDLKNRNLKINTKEVGTYLTPSKVIEEDFLEWYKETYDSSVETIYDVLEKLIEPSTRKVIEYKGGYPFLKKYLLEYLTSNTSIDIKKIYSYIKLINNFWLDLVEQFIPSTTIWSGGTLHKNNLFDSQKHVYKHGINYGSEFDTEILDTPLVKINLSDFSGTYQPIEEESIILQEVGGLHVNSMEFPDFDDKSKKNNILRILVKNDSNLMNITNIPNVEIEGASHIYDEADPLNYRTIVDYGGGNKEIKLFFNDMVYNDDIVFRLQIYPYSESQNEFINNILYEYTLNSDELNNLPVELGEKIATLDVPIRGGEYLIKMGYKYKFIFDEPTETSFKDYYKEATLNGFDELIVYVGEEGGEDIFELDTLTVNDTGIYGIYTNNDYWFSVIERPTTVVFNNGLFDMTSDADALLINQRLHIHTNGQRYFVLEDRPQGDVIVNLNGVSLIKSNFIDYSDDGEYYVRLENSGYVIILNEGININVDDVLSVIYVRNNRTITIAKTQPLYSNGVDLIKIVDPISGDPNVICYEYNFDYDLIDDIPVEQLIIQLNGLMLHLMDDVNLDYEYRVDPNDSRKLLFYFNEELVYNNDVVNDDAIIIYYPLPVEDGLYLESANVRVRWVYYNNLKSGNFLIEVSKDFDFNTVYMSKTTPINEVSVAGNEEYDIFIGVLDLISDVNTTFYYRATVTTENMDLIGNTVNVSTTSTIKTFKTGTVIYA